MRTGKLLTCAAGLMAAVSAITAGAQQPGAASDHPVIVAHRGWLEKSQLENSTDQIEKTVAKGVTWVEIDLGTSKDGTMFLLHDRTLDRTTTAAGPIRAQTDAALDKINLRTAKKTSEETIPRFTDLLDLAKQHEFYIMVDLKDGSPEVAADLLRKANLIDHALFLSFDPATDAHALASDPKILVSVLVKSQTEVDSAKSRANGHPLALYVPHTSAPELFDYAAKTGLPVITDAQDSLDLVVPTEGEGVYAKYLATHPVSLLVTNRPVQLRKNLR